jgi:hypothetical protein
MNKLGLHDFLLFSNRDPSYRKSDVKNIHRPPHPGIKKDHSRGGLFDEKLIPHGYICSFVKATLRMSVLIIAKGWILVFRSPRQTRPQCSFPEGGQRAIFWLQGSGICCITVKTGSFVFYLRNARQDIT